MLYRLLPLLLISLLLSACKLKVFPDEAKIYVVQEIKLGNHVSFFWFRNEVQITREGLSYFQIAENKCDLSVQNANASCQLPYHVMDIKGDTIFVLAQSEIIPLKNSEKYVVWSSGFAHYLYEASKRPPKDSMYFLDTKCK